MVEAESETQPGGLSHGMMEDQVCDSLKYPLTICSADTHADDDTLDMVMCT